jgi:hypothetical protein
MLFEFLCNYCALKNWGRFNKLQSGLRDIVKDCDTQTPIDPSNANDERSTRGA